MPARSPVLRTSTSTVHGASVVAGSSTSQSSYSNVVYVRPDPKKNSGHGGRVDVVAEDLAAPAAGAVVVVGRDRGPALRGSEIGRRPDGVDVAEQHVGDRARRPARPGTHA